MISNSLPESNGKYGRLCTREEWVGWSSQQPKMPLVHLSCQAVRAQSSSTKPRWGLSGCPISTKSTPILSDDLMVNHNFPTQVAIYFGGLSHFQSYVIDEIPGFDGGIPSLKPINPPSKWLKLLATACCSIPCFTVRRFWAAKPSVPWLRQIQGRSWSCFS